MVPIENFPYGDSMSPKNPMHERLLLLKMKQNIGSGYAVGYYDAVQDVFCVNSAHFQNTEDHRYDELPILKQDGRRLDDTWLSDHYCIAPRAFTGSKGARCITHFMPMEDVFIYIWDNDLAVSDIDDVLANAKWNAGYLLITFDKRIMIADVGNFYTAGTQFGASSPSDINGSIYHIVGTVPKSTIKYAVELDKIECQAYQKPRFVDMDGLFDEIQKHDLSHMQQDDIMGRLKDIMDRYATQNKE